MNDDDNDLQAQVAELKQQVAKLQKTQPRGIRKRSERTVCGLPLYDIACGPDPEKSEIRGHARGILAIGDFATGVVAIGGIARGAIAIGGLTLGLVSLGGVSLGLLMALGGLAVGTIAVGGCALGVVALGGLALGFVAVGGQAVGYYAIGGDAVGKYIISPTSRDPIAVDFFHRWFPWLRIGP
jgi:hypothetical protein